MITLTAEQAQIFADMLYCQSVFFKTKSPYMLQRAKFYEAKARNIVDVWLQLDLIHKPESKINPGQGFTGSLFK